jgi:hypothetical protein
MDQATYLKLFADDKTVAVLKTSFAGLSPGAYRIVTCRFEPTDIDNSGLLLNKACSAGDTAEVTHLFYVPFDGNERALNDNLIFLQDNLPAAQKTMLAFNPAGKLEFITPVADSNVVRVTDNVTCCYADLVANAPTEPQPVQVVQAPPAPQPAGPVDALDQSANFPAGTVFCLYGTLVEHLKKYLRTSTHKPTGFKVIQAQSTGLLAVCDDDSLVDAGKKVFIPFGNAETSFDPSPDDPYNFSEVVTERSEQTVYLADCDTYVSYTDFGLICGPTYGWYYDPIVYDPFWPYA